MNRRTFLQRVGVAAGVGVATGDAGGHPTPTGDGSPTTPAETPTGGDPLGTLSLSRAHELVTSPDGHTAYVATGDGVALVDLVSPTAPRVITQRTDLLAESDDGPIQQIQDLAVADGRLLVVGPAHPSEGAHGLVVFDVADRQEPERVAAYETETTIHNCDFDGRYAYLTGNGRPGRPLLIVDTEAEREVGTWSLLDADSRWEAVSPGVRPLHDVIVQDGRAYLAYWDAGTWIVDVEDPTAPALLSRVRGRSRAELAALEDPGVERSEPPGNDHYVTVDEAGTLLGVGGESWDADDDGEGGPSGIELFDISEPTAPESVATIDPPETSDPTFGGVLTTAHNFELTDGRLYSAWYQGGARVHDVREPSEPRELFAWRDSNAASFWTAQRAAGCFVATSTNANGGSEVDPGVYTFPDPAFGDASGAAADASGDGPLGVAGDGFGVVGALAAVGLAAWRLRNR